MRLPLTSTVTVSVDRIPISQCRSGRCRVAAGDAPKGKLIVYLIVWKSEKVGTETDPRTLAPFSGQKLNAGSPDDCGRYTYDAGPH